VWCEASTSSDRGRGSVADRGRGPADPRDCGRPDTAGRRVGTATSQPRP
jgi:hypothetical protein